MASGNFTGNSPVSTNLYVTWSSTPNNSANTSSVTVNLYMRHYAMYATALNGSYLSVGGNSTAYSKSISYGGSSQTLTLLATKTVTVAHNSDGTGTCNITGTFVLNGRLSGTYVGTMTASQVVTLDTIPRSSNITQITNSSGTAISYINSGSEMRVYWTPANNTFKYRVQCIVSGTTYTFPSISTFYTPNRTSSYYASITTAHSWLPNSTSGRVNVRLYTYDSAGIQVGDFKSHSFALNVPALVVPTIDSFTATIVDGKGGYYVQGQSKIRLTVTATKGTGSTNIVSYYFNGPNVTNSSSSTTINSTATTYTLTSGILRSSGTKTYTVTVTDSRDRRTVINVPISIVVQPYAEPLISSISVKRCTQSGVVSSDGTYAYVVINSSYSPISGANTRTIVLTNSSDGFTAGTTIQSTDNTSNTYSGIYGGSFAIGSTYTIRATITDTAYSNSRSEDAILKTAERPVNFAQYGNGVCIGGMSTVTNSSDSGKFECNWDANFKGDIRAGGTDLCMGIISRSNVTDDINNDGIDETANLEMQFYINESGDLTCRRRVSTNNGENFYTQGYWQLRNNDMYVNNNLNVSGDIMYNNGYKIPDIQSGYVVVTPSAADTPTRQSITFPRPFSSIPVVVATPNTAVPGTTVTGVGVASLTETGCDIVVTRTNKTATGVYWIAMSATE